MTKFNFKIGDILFRWVAPLLVLGCAAWYVYAMGTHERPKRKKPPVRKSVPVEVVQAKSHAGPLDVTTNGVVIPHREVKLSARVAGEVVIKSESLSPGNFVEKGELLLQIDPTDYKLEVARLKQELAKVDVDLDRLKVDKANAQRMLAINREIAALRKQDDKRFNRLRSANAASETEADAAQLSVLTAIEKVTDTENQLRGLDSQTKSLVATRELATIQLERANLDLARTEIRAPFSGVVIANHVEQNSNIAVGAMVATIEDTSKVEVRCNLRSDQMDFIYGATPNNSASPSEDPNSNGSQAYRLPTLPVTVEYERAGQTFYWTGVLSRQDGLGIDQNTRTMPVRILVEKPTDSRTENASQTSETEKQRALALVRGMFVKVKLHCQPQTPLMTIPESVLRPGKKVWVMCDGELSVKPIKITRIENGHAYFDSSNSGIAQSDQIISSPVPNAKEGLAVSLKSEKRKGKNGKPGVKESGNKSSVGENGKKATVNPQAS